MGARFDSALRDLRRRLYQGRQIIWARIEDRRSAWPMTTRLCVAAMRRETGASLSSSWTGAVRAAPCSEGPGACAVGTVPVW